MSLVTFACSEICEKLTIKTSERSHWRHSGVFIFNFEKRYFTHCPDLSIFDFEQINGGCVKDLKERNKFDASAKGY